MAQGTKLLRKLHHSADQNKPCYNSHAEEELQQVGTESIKKSGKKGLLARSGSTALKNYYSPNTVVPTFS